jgi:3',5'-cyclic AMP phosphodiesterase CpdA
MTTPFDRRTFLELLSVGGWALGSGLLGFREAHADPKAHDFLFLQLSDTHWGYNGPANPRASETLPRTVKLINEAKVKPDFVVVTGDVSHTTDDPLVRRQRLKEAKAHLDALQVKTLHVLPGEHDASLDAGEAFKEVFGPTHYTFEHQGVRFIALDNVSDPKGKLGDPQLDWFQAELKKSDKDAPLVVLTHRPLFDLMPSWDWATTDGKRALELLAPYRHATVFYGHIHQEHHQTIGNTPHHSARSLVFPLPAPGSVPKKGPVAWDDAHPFKGLGYREAKHAGDGFELKEDDV